MILVLSIPGIYIDIGILSARSSSPVQLRHLKYRQLFTVVRYTRRVLEPGPLPGGPMVENSGGLQVSP